MRFTAVALMVLAIVGPASVAIAVVGLDGELSPVWTMCGLAFSFLVALAGGMVWHSLPEVDEEFLSDLAQELQRSDALEQMAAVVVTLQRQRPIRGGAKPAAVAAPKYHESPPTAAPKPPTRVIMGRALTPDEIEAYKRSEKERAAARILSILHVAPHAQGWAVTTEGQPASSVHPTKGDALARAAELASERHGEVRLHGDEGTIRLIPTVHH